MEIRAKLEDAQGAWPALWLFMSGEEQKRYAEVDIIEELNHEDFVYHTVHTAYTLRDPENGKNPPKHTTSKIKPGKFNIYGAEITDDKIIFSVNNKVSIYISESSTRKRKAVDIRSEYVYLYEQQFSAEGAWAGL